MLQVLRRTYGEKIRLDEFLNFPCSDLRTIDRLWMKYSDGQFGFSVQKRIYESIDGKLDGKFDSDARGNFGKRVRWFPAMRYETLSFNLTAPEGHLPFQVFCGFGASFWELIAGVSSIGARLEKCAGFVDPAGSIKAHAEQCPIAWVDKALSK
ncbi:Serine/threonine protein kinase [Nostoc flagelliforme CCNUN1]|uniref:Serine/threonine protein kinase n=1 Tax=Nostoc flagelliforme CCNUN1 TaxID=2038116 RepID=A0A2K8SJ46_9NOSO|nr:Serine/threonine protein kinase [Nostoc flagelliforme CCNUN1]